MYIIRYTLHSMNSVANPVCFLAPLVKNIKKISLSGGGANVGTERLVSEQGSSNGTMDSLVSGQGPQQRTTENKVQCRLAHLGLPWGLMHVHIPPTPEIGIEEFIENYDAIDPSVYDTLFGLVKTK
jgi:hypothetical protein